MTEQQNKRLRLEIKNMIALCDEYEAATIRRLLFQIDNIQVQIYVTNEPDEFIDKDDILFLNNSKSKTYEQSTRV